MAEPNFQNRTLYHGDNLDFLRGMNSETVHLIATDPPFNKSKDFHATPDSIASGARFQDRWSWRNDIHDDWLIRLQKDEPEVWQIITATKQVYGDDMAAFLCFMGVRLLEMRRVLKDGGSIYLHCDTTASHYLKMLMDAIFGRQNFRNEIIWRRYGSHNDVGQGSQHFGRTHDALLFYVKEWQSCWNQEFNPLGEAYVASTYRQIEADTGRKYSTSPLTGPGGAAKGNPVYEWNGHTRAWRYSRETMERLELEGRLHYSKTGYPRQKSYLDESKGVPVQDIWADIGSLSGSHRERTGFPTQKPLALYERIIKASSNPGDVVLDPFCGCATTPVAAERLERQWVGMDIWDGAHEMVLNRLEAEGLAIKDRRGRRQGQQTLVFADIQYKKAPPKRTDEGEVAALTLRTPMGQRGAMRNPPPRSQHGRLLLDIGAYCQGCGRDYRFDPRVLEVDHIRPRADGGTDAFDNLTLLCPPCNKEKRDRLALSGLQDFNRRNGYLLAENEGNISIGRVTRRAGSRRRSR